jgi:RNA recognition motif-containing protein
MAAEEGPFPRTVFVENLPDEYSLANLAAFLEPFGNILEIQVMEDGHVLVRFQEGASAKKVFSRSLAKRRKNLVFQGRELRVVPKKQRKSAE